MCSSNSSVRIGTTSPRLLRTLRGLTSSPDQADSCGKRAAVAARLRTADRRLAVPTMTSAGRLVAAG
jgi:hypothetical protein